MAGYGMPGKTFLTDIFPGSIDRGSLPLSGVLSFTLAAWSFGLVTLERQQWLFDFSLC